MWWRIIIFCGGSLFLLAGIVMLILPGPAIIFIPLGLAILATEFRWAKKLLVRAREWIRGQKEERQNKT
jgi:hypothetical protein